MKRDRPRRATELFDAPNTVQAGRFRFCFPSGTPISTPNGPRAIQQIGENDIVYSWNFETAKIAERRVKAAFVRQTHQLVKITLNDGKYIETTGGHPFWVENDGWTLAEDLEVGNQLRSFNGDRIAIAAIDWQDGLHAVYNFEVEVDHNYFAGTSQLLVHNEGGDDFNTAIQKALAWLKGQGVDLGKPTGVVIGKFGPNAGSPIGVKFEGGGYYRIEFDARSGAHINVGVGKNTGPHVTFQGNQNTVNTAVKRLFTC